VLVPLNTRLTASDYAYILEHSGARLLFGYRGLESVITDALARLPSPPRLVWIEPEWQGDYEQLASGGPSIALRRPADERALLSINYTSGTTGRPKGVMTSHRGAYLHSLGVIAESQLQPRSAYLWTLPMFHCNGWCYPWAVTAAGGQHVCLPAIDPAAIWRALHEQAITHLCAAPTVVTMLLAAPEASPCQTQVRLFTGGAPPSPALLQRAGDLNIAVTHLYGLTETYGPLAVCAWSPDWDGLPADQQAVLKARQGVGTIVTEQLRVVDGEMRDVPRDGLTMGEIVMRGNNVMLGYYRDPEATAAAFRGGWFHSGDLGVMHPDGYIELRDRLKDVVISGGENIATVEVEQVLSAHETVSEVAVVAAPDAFWGEIPVAFVTARGATPPEPDELRAFAQVRLAHFKVPKRIVLVDELPKTGTGKIQKFVLREQARALVESEQRATADS
jgi:fatty-acyl-CoA synthase